jgi:tRNA 2-thiouridine synthesizing protein A
VSSETEILDARGLKCPLPVLKMEKRLAALPAGARLDVLATDPMARVDIPLYCRRHGHVCTAAEAVDGLRFAITKATIRSVSRMD